MVNRDGRLPVERAYPIAAGPVRIEAERRGRFAKVRIGTLAQLTVNVRIKRIALDDEVTVVVPLPRERVGGGHKRMHADGVGLCFLQHIASKGCLERRS